MIYNAQRREIQLLELTCSFNSTEHLQAARERKSNKVEYQLLLSELDHLGYISQYWLLKLAVWVIIFQTQSGPYKQQLGSLQKLV